MFLVTWEENNGIWLDAPEGFDTEKEAREYAAIYPARTGAVVAIYECRLVDTIPSPAPPAELTK